MPKLKLKFPRFLASGLTHLSQVKHNHCHIINNKDSLKTQLATKGVVVHRVSGKRRGSCCMRVLHPCLKLHDMVTVALWTLQDNFPPCKQNDIKPKVKLSRSSLTLRRKQVNSLPFAVNHDFYRNNFAKSYWKLATPVSSYNCHMCLAIILFFPKRYFHTY